MKRIEYSILLVVLLVAVSPLQAQTPTTGIDYYNRGIDRKANGDLDGAIADFNQAIELNPRHALAYNNRGTARLTKSDIDGAIADYTKAIEIDPRHASAYNNRGIARAEKGDLDGAIADFNKAIEIDPRDADTYNNRGSARKTKGDLDGAIADYIRAIEIDPRQANAYYNRGIARADKGDLDGAIADYTKDIEIDPRDMNGYIGRGLAQYRKADYEGAIADYNKVIELHPDYSNAYAQRGLAKLRQGKEAEAQHDFDTALKIDPGGKSVLEEAINKIKQSHSQASALSYNYRGLVRSDKGDYDGAIADFTKAVEITPQFAEAYYARGDARAAKGDYDGAIADYTKAIEIRPEYPGAYAFRGFAKLRQGKDAEAQQDFDLAIKIRPDYRASLQKQIDEIKQARAQQTAPQKVIKAPTAAEIAVNAVKENDPATLSFSDWEYVLSFRDSSPANKQAAERVWQVIRESVEHNGTVKLKIPVKVISATGDTIEAAITDENIQANRADLEIAMEGTMSKPPAPGSRIEIIGVLTEYRLSPFMFVMKQGKLSAQTAPTSADALIRAGKFAEAKKELESYLSSHPGDAGTEALLGVAEEYLDDAQDAVAAFDVAGTIPDQFKVIASKAYADAAVEALKARNNEQAIILAGKSITLQPSVSTLFIRGTAYANAQKYPQAITDLEKAKTQATGGHADAATLNAIDASLATSYLFGGQTDKGLALARALKQSDPSNTRVDDALVAYYNQQAIPVLQAGKIDEAVADFETAAKEVPARAAVLYVQAANVLAQAPQPDWKRVQTEAEKALAITPNDAVANYVVGIALGNQGNKSDAVQYLQKAKANAGSDASLNANIDAALTRLGQQ